MSEVRSQSVPPLPAFGGLRVPSYAENQYPETYAIFECDHGDDTTPIPQDWRTDTRTENQGQSRIILGLSAEGYFWTKLSNIRTAARNLVVSS